MISSEKLRKKLPV